MMAIQSFTRYTLGCLRIRKAELPPQCNGAGGLAVDQVYLTVLISRLRTSLVLMALVVNRLEEVRPR